ncbi:hypothetical protein [Nostoc sp.]
MPTVVTEPSRWRSLRREVRATPKQYYNINKKRSLFSCEFLQDINIES